MAIFDDPYLQQIYDEGLLTIDDDTDKLTVRQLCRTQTFPHELVIIRDSGYVVAAVYIDYEDLFCIPERYANQTVRNAERGAIPVHIGPGVEASIPCLYIDVGE